MIPLRDWFAGQALVGLIYRELDSTTSEILAAEAYAIADAMMTVGGHIPEPPDLTKPDLDREFAPQGCPAAAREAAARIREGWEPPRAHSTHTLPGGQPGAPTDTRPPESA